MPKQNFKSHAKRKRELAKLDKRQAKDQKRALRRAEGSEAVAALGTAPDVVAVAKPWTLAEAVERWKKTNVAKLTRR